ncbi:predicted protein [Sclerotinia sclerotiorum 1980 UF-70]|uniref:Uncharacterized protein n=1 Tax=Sclerotinia sclerotiorum (strain ATCC 18683 / 1980 / Ss-1) TaxID=665079 RepID=A7F9R5_SCLS1|nr:predicted protein [Sclerotinia sclerotiorum 1980 UF-70]EDO00476.1 predicted protein [Sclerotinia sclerotiorum 1980 UF-70]
MEQNGTNNGQDAKPPASSAAAGAKKRRKVNHGMQKFPKGTNDFQV